MYTINDLFQIGREIDPSVLLEEAKKKFQQKNIEEEKIGNFLTNIFYESQENNKNFQELLNKNIMTYLEGKIQKNILPKIENLLSSDRVEINLSGDNSDKIELTDWVSYSHKKYIEEETILLRLKQVKDKLSFLKNDNSLYQKYETLLKELQNFEKQTKSLRGKEYVYWINDQNKDLIDRIDNLYKELTYFSSLPIPPDALGEIFEKALSAFTIYVKNYGVENVDKMVEETFNQKTTGNEIAYRGKFKDISIVGKNQSKLKIGSTFAGRKGKADVTLELDLPNIGNSSFKVSAKNWGVLDGKDFGDINLWNALARSSQHYGQVMGYGVQMIRGKYKKITLHQWARMCILLDSLMGYSQKNNYADTIIINDRGNKKIRVYSINNIINNYYNQKSKQFIIGYNDNNIPEILSNGIPPRTHLGPRLAKLQSNMREVSLKVSAGILNLA